MKRFLIGLATALVLGGLAYSQSLGDVARANRATPKKKAAHVYTNEEIPEARMAPKPVAPDDASAKPAETRTEESASPDAEKDKKSDPDALANAKDGLLSLNIDEQKAKVALLERELGVMEGEYKLQTTNYWMDATSRLQNSKNWTEKRRTLENGIEAKRKELEDARVLLDGFREQGRHAGTTPAERE